MSTRSPWVVTRPSERLSVCSNPRCRSDHYRDWTHCKQGRSQTTCGSGAAIWLALNPSVGDAVVRGDAGGREPAGRAVRLLRSLGGVLQEVLAEHRLLALV